LTKSSKTYNGERRASVINVPEKTEYSHRKD
jgi:hypothetical protein